jgi:hypothetical protein
MAEYQLELFPGEYHAPDMPAPDILAVVEDNWFGLDIRYCPGPEDFVTTVPNMLGNITVLDNMDYEIDMRVAPPDPRIAHLVQ